MFRGSFDRDSVISKDANVMNILYLNASHGPQSLVGCGARTFLDNLKTEHKIREVNLWKDSLVSYRLEHAISKMNILNNKGTEEDKKVFDPVLQEAELINSVDLVLISTPMWNYSIPYTLKQYIDVIVQPGINFSDEPPPADGHTGAAGKHVLVISSAGGTYPRSGPLQDFLNPYLQQIFALMGFTQFRNIFIQNTMKVSKQESLEWTKDQAIYHATEISKHFNAKTI